MTAYVKSVLENKEIVTLEHDANYFGIHENVLDELEADLLSLEEIENVSNMEQKLYAYLKNQDVMLLSGNIEYTTALVNFPEYKAINLERYLLKREKSTERLFSLSHEIGHYLDMKFNHNGDAINFQSCYEVNCEVMELVAWAYGWKILEALGCTLKGKFDRLAFECLSSYTKSKQKALYSLMNIEEIVSDYENKIKKEYEK